MTNNESKKIRQVKAKETWLSVDEGYIYVDEGINDGMTNNKDYLVQTEKTGISNYNKTTSRYE